MVTALGGQGEHEVVDSSVSLDDNMSNVVFGMILALVAAIFYGWVYVLTEQIVKGNLEGLSGVLPPPQSGWRRFPASPAVC